MPTCRYTVPESAPTHAPALARGEVAGVLRGQGVVEDARFDDALLVTSELVTNAVRHAGPAIGLNIVTLPRGVLRLEVSDGGNQRSVRRSHTPGRDGGWGLNVVHRLAQEWGAYPARRGPGKTVWAELEMSYDDLSSESNA